MKIDPVMMEPNDFMKATEELASTCNSKVIEIIRLHKGIEADGHLNAIGRYVLYQLVRRYLRLLDRQGDLRYHDRKLDPENMATGHKIVSWLLGFTMRLRRTEPKPPKEKIHFEEEGEDAEETP